jgi:hypothetical protein
LDKKKMTFYYRLLLNRGDFMGRFDCTFLMGRSDCTSLMGRFDCASLMGRFYCTSLIDMFDYFPHGQV